MPIFTKRTFATALIMLALPTGFPTAALAAGIGHTLFMRGSVVDMTGGVPTICIGKADGALAGQVLDVYRVTAVQGMKAAFFRKHVGSIRIAAIVDDHFATTAVIKGNIAKHDIVEMSRK